MIRLENVSFGYEKEQMILKDISFAVEKGASIGLVGANGVGKSTLLKLLVGLNLQYEGTLQVCGLPVEKKALADIRRRTGYVFQDSDSQLFLSTVFEDVAFGPRNYGLSEEEVNERVAEALRLPGIAHLQDKQLYKLSGGEKKLASIATILSMNPDLILMDEPSVALDPRNRRNLIRLLNSFAQTKLIASHDLDLILQTCQRTILLAEGGIVFDGPTKDVLLDQAFLEANGL